MAQKLYRKKKYRMDLIILELIRRLQKTDHENEYYIFVKPDKDDLILSETPNFHIIEIAAAPYPIWEQILLPRKLKKIKPDILHCTGNTAPLFCTVPLVLTLHDILYMKGINFSRGTWYQRLGNLYRKWIVPRIIPHCEKIITVSDFEKQEIGACFPLLRNKIKRVYNAYNPSFRLIPAEEELLPYKSKFNLPDRFILYLGNTHPNKNIKNVLIALKMLHQDEATRLPLVMPDINKSFLESMLEEIDCPELFSTIHLTGYLPNQVLPYLYNLATVFLYPSFYESFGIPILEAMASGTPVVASNRAAIPETAGQAATFIDPEKPEEIYEAVQKLMLNEETYITKREIGLQQARLFNWRYTASHTLEVYKDVCQKIHPKAIKQQA